MLHMKYLFYFIILQLVFTTPQLNFYFTDLIGENKNINTLQHHCLRITSSGIFSFSYQIISYCISESSLKFNTEKTDILSSFTFIELSRKNISSQQLYLWSAPIDIIERYQFYLNQLLTSNESSLSKEVFYNCTLPRFGPMCQYEFVYHHLTHTSLFKIIDDFYYDNPYQPDDLTCYIHLECDRGPGLGCLDWSEICDGYINCLNNGIDEEYCWQLEINDCEDNEYRCNNGQCIPSDLFLDPTDFPSCLDRSDKNQLYTNENDYYYWSDSNLSFDDTTCKYTFLSSSCLLGRHILLIKSLFSIKENNVSDDCWLAFICKLEIFNEYCINFNNLKDNNQIIEETCPDILKIPSVPILFGNIYFMYIKNNSKNYNNKRYWDSYICYNNSLYDNYFSNISKISFNNMTCYYDVIWDLNDDFQIWMRKFFTYRYRFLQKYNPFLNYSSIICNRTTMYQCINSSICISIYRLKDSIYDCPYYDDEHDNIINNTALQKIFRRKTFKCPNQEKYILLLRVENIECSCKYLGDQQCANDKFLWQVPMKTVSFQIVCDGFIDFESTIINEQNETDETECEQWPCNNLYTRCDGIWHCINGLDELNCSILTSLNCSLNQHTCVSPYTNQLMCLINEKINDGNIDCLGGIDEPKICRRKSNSDRFNEFRCINSTSKPCINSDNICDGHKDCIYGDDEQFCEITQLPGEWTNICRSYYVSHNININDIICHSLEIRKGRSQKFFTLNEIMNINNYLTNNIDRSNRLISYPIKTFNDSKSRCHRGIDLKVWLNNENNLTTRTCLCPPNYYGNKCQYQNQRIILIMQFAPTGSSYQIPFAIVVSLIDDDNERKIHSYEQFTYFPKRDCSKIFYIYLTYSNRPKNQTKHYSIHIDIYEKISLGYRGSLLLPIKFSFLPVHRLAYKIIIPPNNESILSCSKHKCNHGKCIRYINNSRRASFCQCDREWSGQYCNIPHTCMCSLDSLCIGVSADNRSVCVCPIYRFGSRCFLINPVCQENGNTTCPNGGQCIPDDDTYANKNHQFTCICPKGFYGLQCQPANNKLILSFEKDIDIPQSLIIHFIEVHNRFDPIVTTTFETIPIRKNSIIIDWLMKFHIIITEFHKTSYYLTAVKNTYNSSAIIVKMINSSDRCRHTNELFNETMIKLPLIRRIKYYHLLCKTYSPYLFCFYDDINFCLCYDYDQQRLANCFKFNFNMTFNCYGFSDCENEAQCFQQKLDCPEKNMCVCPPCFYGLRCQFSTSGFGLSLDGILGYHIQPHINIIQQPSIVKISIALNIIFITIGIINSILSMITFMNKTVCEVGCGLYLLASSFSSLLVMIMFGLKFWILILGQMSIIENRLFLYIQCRSIDFILRICLYMDQWLSACVAIERATTTMQGARFQKKRSKKIAKLVIIIVLILIILTNIHEPIYRRLIDEENDNEKRIWCIVTYPSSLKIYNSVMHTLHFFIPFIFNFISAIILITKKTRQQLNLRPSLKYKEALRKELKQHKHLIIAPIILVILALPRLIISFVSKCMKSANDSWLFLIGYFISFIPAMLTFLIFIIPSKFYKKQFNNTITRYRNSIRKQLTVIL